MLASQIVQMKAPHIHKHSIWTWLNAFLSGNIARWGSVSCISDTPCFCSTLLFCYWFVHLLGSPVSCFPLISFCVSNLYVFMSVCKLLSRILLPSSLNIFLLSQLVLNFCLLTMVIWLWNIFFYMDYLLLIIFFCTFLTLSAMVCQGYT